MSATYSITYAVGTSRFDERHYVAKVGAALLAVKIRAIQGEGHRIIRVELAA